MPIGTCDPATRGATFNEFGLEIANPDGTGYVLVSCRFGWDGISTRATGCDGPTIFIRARNTSATTAWALLADKKHGNPWVQMDPGTDVTTSNAGVLSTLGLSNASDIRAVKFSFVDPA